MLLALVLVLLLLFVFVSDRPELFLALSTVALMVLNRVAVGVRICHHHCHHDHHRQGHHIVTVGTAITILSITIVMVNTSTRWHHDVHNHAR